MKFRVEQSFGRIFIWLVNIAYWLEIVFLELSEKPEFAWKENVQTGSALGCCQCLVSSMCVYIFF